MLHPAIQPAHSIVDATANCMLLSVASAGGGLQCGQPLHSPGEWQQQIVAQYCTPCIDCGTVWHSGSNRFTNLASGSSRLWHSTAQYGTAAVQMCSTRSSSALHDSQLGCARGQWPSLCCKGVASAAEAGSASMCCTLESHQACQSTQPQTTGTAAADKQT